ncbi:uncharacterized protein LOC136015387 isoform X2 [Lathamus discolor]|uniref:uncharacterized protein LOC136015387 isoform X2 n=1 Tax=Lathamus discolor TaxID=678569 RepID=UPI0032B76E9D
MAGPAGEGKGGKRRGERGSLRALSGPSPAAPSFRPSSASAASSPQCTAGAASASGPRPAAACRRRGRGVCPVRALVGGERAGPRRCGAGPGCVAPHAREQTSNSWTPGGAEDQLEKKVKCVQRSKGLLFLISDVSYKGWFSYIHHLFNAK